MEFEIKTFAPLPERTKRYFPFDKLSVGEGFDVVIQGTVNLHYMRAICYQFSKKLGRQFRCAKIDDVTIRVRRNEDIPGQVPTAGRVGRPKKAKAEAVPSPSADEAPAPRPALPPELQRKIDEDMAYRAECEARGSKPTQAGFDVWRAAREAPQAVLPGSWVKPEVEAPETVSQSPWQRPCANPSCGRLPGDHPGWGCAEWVAS